MSKIRLNLMVIGFGLLLTAYILMSLAFFFAYFNGGDVTIHVNRFGEGNLEFLAFVLSVIPIFYFSKVFIKEFYGVRA